MMRKLRSRFIHLRLGALLFGLLLVALSGCARHQFSGVVFDAPQTAAEIAGVDHTGEPFALSNHQGEMVLIFFGYTNCPDVCPMTLAEIATAYDQLAAESPRLIDDLNVLFVTTDPERDTPERLAEYVPLFNETFRGIYVPPQDQESVKAAYGVYSEKNTENVPDEGGYFVDHTAGIYLVDRSGRLLALFRNDTSASALAADLKVLLKR